MPRSWRNSVSACLATVGNGERLRHIDALRGLARGGVIRHGRALVQVGRRAVECRAYVGGQSIGAWVGIGNSFLDLLKQLEPCHHEPL
jgi:hypothetical protein